MIFKYFLPFHRLPFNFVDVHTVIYQLYLNKAGKKEVWEMLKKKKRETYQWIAMYIDIIFPDSKNYFKKWNNMYTRYLVILRNFLMILRNLVRWWHSYFCKEFFCYRDTQWNYYRWNVVTTGICFKITAREWHYKGNKNEHKLIMS